MPEFQKTIWISADLDSLVWTGADKPQLTGEKLMNADVMLDANGSETVAAIWHRCVQNIIMLNLLSIISF